MNILQFYSTLLFGFLTLLNICFVEKVLCVDVIVDLPGLGALNGTITEGKWTGKLIYRFLDVKFAESPSGRHRFKAPVRKLPWNDIRNAQQYGRQCPVLANLLLLTPEELTQDIEDCLHMSIYSGNLTPTVGVPVMVYIHGGAFIDGATMHHPPNYLLEKDIVLVVPQYRLGPLGFLSTMTQEIPGNAAILDVILALRWIQQYIEHFGGDPNQITLFGQSAGAAIVSSLILTPAVPTTLFHKVIIQSGSSMSSWTVDTDPIGHARDIGRAVGCNLTEPIRALNECFMTVDVLTLLWGFTEHLILGSMIGPEHHGGNKITIGGPTNIFPMTPYQLMRNGFARQNLPMMAGVTKHDGTFALANVYDILINTIGVDNTNFNSFKMIDTINQLYGVDDPSGSFTGFLTKKLFTQNQLINGTFNDMLDGFIDQSSVSMIKGPTLRAIQANAQINPYNTYLYTFDYDGEFTRFGYGADTSHYPFDGGIHHSNENIYIFPWPEFVSQLNENDTKMSQKMIDLWTSFAINGIPHSENCIQWPSVTNISGPYMHLNDVCTIGIDFLDEYSVTVREGMPQQRNNRITQFMINPKIEMNKIMKKNNININYNN